MTTLRQEFRLQPTARARMRILVRGAVQGVGFRPFVFRHARALGLSGWVGNSGEGVLLEAEGNPKSLAALIDKIRAAPPANARVTALESRDIAPQGSEVFAIRESAISSARTVEVLPDLGTCDACLSELFDPADRRYLYPFLNCTQCGPRYSIIEDLPYDRARTVMRAFPLCTTCRAEYENPLDRRFHAEPIACPACGPRLQLWDAEGATLARDHDALQAAAGAVRRGQIVAVMGIGGFHLMADARDENAIGRLRQRKGRPEKPFAVMFPSFAALTESCHVSPPEEELLRGPARPIVLLRRRGETVVPAVATLVAPATPWLGAFLPYTPLHHLLLHELGFPVVATSGNVSDEPIVTDNTEALSRLGAIADLFLVHDRPILRPVDDSVVRVVGGRALMLRRARGYAPAAIPVVDMPEGIVAVGGHLKTTVAVSRAGAVVVSPHIGDLDLGAARAAHARAVTDAVHLHGTPPRVVACDQHPDYASRRAAEAMAFPCVAVQHHVAHIASCLADNGLAPPALGVAWDGAGYGPDGTVWGGEFLEVTRAGWRRVAHLRPFPLPGGDEAAREPRRAALGLLYAAFGTDALTMTALPPIADFTPAERAVLRSQLAHGLNAPFSSSAGRLFDAFAALCGFRQRASYEGQAAALLEAAADGNRAPAHMFALREGAPNTPLIVDWQPALEAALADLAAGVESGAVAAAFHEGLAAAIAAVARRLGPSRVALTGGCFQNARLTEATVAALRAAGCEAVWHRQVPPNDGGLALGQAVWAAWTQQSGTAPQGEVPCA